MSKKTKDKTTKSRKGRIGFGILVLVILLIILFLNTIVGFISDFLWFKDLGYIGVFFIKLFTQLKLGIPSFILIAAAALLYLFALKRNYYKKIETADGDDFPKSGNKVTVGVSIVFSLALTVTLVTSLWKEILYCMNSTAFGVQDPIFGHDISFYVFRVVLFEHVTQILLGLVISFVVLTLFYYIYLMSVSHPKIFGGEGAEEQEPEYIEGQVEPEAEEFFNGPFGIKFRKPPVRSARQHSQQNSNGLNKVNLSELMGFASTQIIILAVFFFITVALDFVLRQYGLLYSATGSVYGAGFTDMHVTLWVYRIIMVLAIASAILFIIGVKQKKYKRIIILPVLMILISFAGTGVSAVVQSLIVSPDELNKESPYLQNNITYTQQAYDLTGIEEKAFQASNTLTGDDILNNLATITNIRINDYQPAKQFYNQTQSIRTYYRFNDVDVDRYNIDGEYTQVFLSAREIDDTKIDSSQWLTQHIKYTHGYGITLSRVDKVTASGQPDMIVDSIPPVSDAPELNVTRPEIYFGELTNNYIITNTSESEFDYPSGSSNIYTEYEGTTGINLSFFNRILYAIKEQNIKILVSTNINSDSKIIYDRDVMDRVLKIAPFFAYDDDPYIVVSDEGKLYWIIDGYTTSSYYPYATPYSEDTTLNYIRNSVKVVVDAYNGTVDFYQVDGKDPIATTVGKIYPGLMKDFSEMPADLRDNVRYPAALFDIQAVVYKRYHMSNVNTFYQSEDVWDIAKEIYGTTEQEMTPNYYIMKLPGEEREEFISSIPYTPKDKNNMTGLLVVRNDGEHYGEMVLYSLSKDRTIYGPMQIESQIDQDTDISKEFSLWSSAGSTYTRGNMFVIPIETSLIYVEPIYLEADNENSLPEVKRVIVAYGDRIAYKPTLAEALDALFGTGTDFTGQGSGEAGSGSSGTSSGSEIKTVDDLIVLANEAFENAQASQQNGDWAAYGKYQNELEGYLQEMANVSGEAGTQMGEAEGTEGSEPSVSETADLGTSETSGESSVSDDSADGESSESGEGTSGISNIQ